MKKLFILLFAVTLLGCQKTELEDIKVELKPVKGYYSIINRIKISEGEYGSQQGLTYGYVLNGDSVIFHSNSIGYSGLIELQPNDIFTVFGISDTSISYITVGMEFGYYKDETMHQGKASLTYNYR